MSKKSYKFLALLMCAILVSGAVGERQIYASTNSSKVWVDGIAYEYSLDSKGVLTVNAVDNDLYGEIKLYSNGNAVANVLNEDNKKVKYNLDINTLTSDDVDIDVLNTQGKVVKTYNDVEDIIEDEYDG